MQPAQPVDADADAATACHRPSSICNHIYLSMTRMNPSPSIHGLLRRSASHSHGLAAGRWAFGYEPSFSSQNMEEKHCIRIHVAFRLYLVKNYPNFD
jgi:hypothetical protein